MKRESDKVQAVTSVEYSIVFSERKTMVIYVKEDQSVEVRAPLHCSREEIVGYVYSNSSWIRNKQRQFELRPPKYTPGYGLGSHHYYLGEPATLAQDRESREGVIGLGPLREINEYTVTKKLESWYRKQARKIYTERHQYWRNVMSDRVLPESTVTVRKMRRRWGSCSSEGVITLNLSLIKYPAECVDCVIVHELCHLLEFNHSRVFYRLMSEYLPDWKRIDEKLTGLSWQY